LPDFFGVARAGVTTPTDITPSSMQKRTRTTFAA